MKLLKLEILNLASLDRQEGEVIDFEKGALKESTIFSIVGPTGSGKSTILDAICLALYNRAPRYPKKKGDRKQNIEIYGEADDSEKNRLAPTDPRNILTHGKKHGYSKLTFLANNGTFYRAEWHVEFKTKKHGEAITSLYTIDSATGNETPADWSALPQIIGLEYDQFLRTVLIAQGSFANFLNSNEQERYELLEKLIGNESLYVSIVEKIKAKKDEAVSNYTDLSASTKAYEKDMIDSKDELDELNSRIAVLEQESQLDKKELESIIEQLGWYAADQKRVENIEAYRKELEKAMSLIERHRESAQRLKLHDVTQPAVKIYNAWVIADNNIRKQNETLEHLKRSHQTSAETLKTVVESLSALNEAHAAAVRTHDEQKPHIKQAIKIKGELNEIIRSLKSRQTVATDAATAFDAACKAVEKNAADIIAKQKELEQRRDELRDLGKSVEERSAVLQKALQEAEGVCLTEGLKIKDIDPDKLQAEKRRHDSISGEIKEGIRICSQIQEKAAALKADKEQSEKLQMRNAEIDIELGKLTIDQLTKEIETLNRTYTLMTSENWREHRRLLKDQKPCPLCGAIEHPYSEDKDLQPLVNEMSGLIVQKQEALSLQNERSKTLNNEKNQNAGKLIHLSESIPSMTMDLEKLESEWHALTENHPDWKKDLEVLEEYRADAELACKAAEKAVDDYNRTAKKLAVLGSKKEEAQKTLENYKEFAVKTITGAQEQVTQANLGLNTVVAQTDTLQKQMKDRETEKNNAQAALTESQDTKMQKEKELKDEIGDRDPVQYERSLEESVRSAAEALEKKNAEAVEIRAQIENVNGMIKATQGAIDEEKQTAVEKNQELLQWLRAYNTDREDNLLGVEDIILMHGATDNWEDIRSMLKKQDDDFTSKKTILENEEKLHRKNQDEKPEKSQDELALKKVALESKSYDELVSSKARLQNHENAVKMIGNMADVVRKAKQTKEDWEQITEAIGTDGKTLRKIAQCYTLRFLIEHANDEIRKFNSRFELMQVKNSLGIRVIDHDRADGIRDTTSLSGGETFIVSLGLALGLSSLSSRNVAFENLFIDEGFGTLDPETLDTVIDSLAILQSSQGKKVGVISHTSSMSDRITTRICVIKKGNSGSSYIEIEP